MDTHTPWKLEGANERIEKYRKGTAKIEFYKEGKKINTNGVIDLKLINHEFKFGVSMTQSRGLMQRGDSFESTDFIFYKEKVKEIFNFITIGMYWYALDDTRINFEKDMRNYISHVIEWGLKNDLEIKGHPLLWHESNPKWVENNKNPKKLEKEIYRRIKSLIEDYPEIKYSVNNP
jgi:GH35 family endo-1,4-beta-xylanase